MVVVIVIIIILKFSYYQHMDRD